MSVSTEMKLFKFLVSFLFSSDIRSEGSIAVEFFFGEFRFYIIPTPSKSVLEKYLCLYMCVCVCLSVCVTVAERRA